MNNRISNRTPFNFTGTHSWKDELEQIIHDNNSINLDGSKARPATMKDRSSSLMGMLEYLREHGYTLEPTNLKPKHINALCKHYESKQLAPTTIRKYMGYLQAYCSWIAKGGMLHGWEAYFSAGYLGSPTVASSFERRQPEGTDLVEALREIRSADPYVWHQLIVQAAFGLKRKDTMLLMPVVDVVDDKLHVISRTRCKEVLIIQIETPFQRRVIELARAFVGGAIKNLCLPGRNAQKCMKHFSNTLHRSGIGKAKSAAMLQAIETLVMEG